MNLVRRLAWRLKGEAATMMEEEYEDTADAVIYPCLSVLMSVGFLATSDVLLGLGGVMNTVGAVLFALLTLVIGGRLPSVLLASVWYYREQTTEPPATEVSH